MTTFVLLRIEDDDQAATLIDDISENPDCALLTPSQENLVDVTIESVSHGDAP